MKIQIFLVSFFIMVLLVYSDVPVGYNSYEFPGYVKESWRNTNNLRNLPSPELTYFATDSTKIVKNGIEFNVPFYANCDSCNSASLNSFINLVSNDNNQLPIELSFPEGVYLFKEPIKDTINYHVYNVILSGDGGRKTVFHFDLNSDEITQDYERNCVDYRYSTYVSEIFTTSASSSKSSNQGKKR